MGKKNSPYELEKDYWDTLPKAARQWVDRYAKAVEFGNFEVLQGLCDDAPSDQFEEIKSEVMYERDFYKRDQYTIPSQYNSTYTEWDYSWQAPNKENVKEAVANEFYGEDREDYINKPEYKRRKAK